MSDRPPPLPPRTAPSGLASPFVTITGPTSANITWGKYRTITPTKYIRRTEIALISIYSKFVHGHYKGVSENYLPTLIDSYFCEMLYFEPPSPLQVLLTSPMA